MEIILGLVAGALIVLVIANLSSSGKEWRRRPWRERLGGRLAGLLRLQL